MEVVENVEVVEVVEEWEVWDVLEVLQKVVEGCKCFETGVKGWRRLKEVEGG